MKASFRSTYWDLIAFNFHHFFLSPIFFGVIGLILVIGIGPNWQAAVGHGEERSLFLILALFTILELAPVVVVYLGLSLTLLVANISKLNRTFLTDNSILLSNDSILSESRYSLAELKWTAVQKLVRTKSHIFLYITQNGALIIPRRAFDNNEDWEQFWAICQARAQAPDKSHKQTDRI